MSVYRKSRDNLGGQHTRSAPDPARAGSSLLRIAMLFVFVAAVANSRIPDRIVRRLLPGFAAPAVVVPIAGFSLVVGEFPLHALILQVIYAARFVRRGALCDDRGRWGFLVLVVSAAELVVSWRKVRSAPKTLDDALKAALGSDYRDQLPPIPPAENPLRLIKTWFPRFSERRRFLRQENLSYGEAGVRNQLDIWHRPDVEVDGRAPVLIQIHGSGWVKGSKRGQGYPLMAHMAERGWVCVAINYSLAPAARWPAHIIDVKRAIAWVRENIADYGGDPDFIVVTGGSAGGHLAALAGLTQNETRFQPGFESSDTSLAAAVPLYGVYDLLDRAGDSPREQREFLTRIVIGASAETAYDTWHDGSPLSWVKADAPPFLIIHGSVDTLTNPEQARAFSTALAAVSDQPVSYAELVGAQHAFDVLPSVRTAATVAAVDRFLSFLHKNRR